ncbi:MAG: alpha/beta hydrolase [Anaerolineae bacterium]|nr:alpha/beta hydrolase [Anaerolineae bacterium]
MDAPITFQEVHGLKIAHAVLGSSGPAVVMLHGWGANLELMLPLAQRLVPFGYQVYVPDLPGFGKSEWPSEAWSVHDYANMALNYLDQNQMDVVYLVGHSFGGRLGLILGADHSARFRKMALIDSAGVRTPPALRNQLRLKGYRFGLNALRAVRLRAQADRLRTWYSDRYGSSDYKAATGVMRETFVRVVNEDLLPYAARVQVPTLLFWGDQDQDTPLAQGQLLEKTIPDAGLVVWEGAGHYSYLDRLADTARVIDHFFRQESS